MGDVKKRCDWAADDLSIKYHDSEWGIPLYDDNKLFEMLILEGMQAGLSWKLILQKRESMCRAFNNFEAEVIAAYDENKCSELLLDAGVIRNRLKIKSLVTNARAFLRVKKDYGSFNNYIWKFTEGTPIINTWITKEQVPNKTEISIKMSIELAKQGFKFVGPTICYSYMQSIGMVNDHLITCDFYNS